MLTRARGECAVVLALVVAPFLDAERIGRHGAVLIEAAEDEHPPVGQRRRRRIPARVLLVGRIRGLRALLVARIAAGIERRVWRAREQFAAERIARPVRSGARLAAARPQLGLRIEDVDLVQPVVALHVVTAEHVDASIGQRHAGVAVGVVEIPLRVAVLGKRGAIQREVVFVEQRGMEFPGVLERIGMERIEQQLPLHRPVRDDPRRHALAQALPHQIPAVGQPLERVVGGPVRAEREERIEPVQDIAQRRVELIPRRRQRAVRDRQVGERRVGHVVHGDIRETARGRESSAGPSSASTRGPCAPLRRFASE